VFEIRVLRRLVGQRRDEIIRGLKKLQNYEFHNMYFSSYVIRMMKSRRMRWAGQVARKGEMMKHTRFLWEARRKETTRKINM
jgi:hypothetical protein